MAKILISSLLPIVITLLVGYFAGFKRDFAEPDAALLNKVIMKYTLPLSLFGGIISTKRTEILQNVSVTFWIFSGMVGGYLVFFLSAHYLFKTNLRLAALRALTISGPAIPFVGPVILGALFPKERSLLIGIGSLILSTIQLPISVMILSTATKTQRNSFFKNVISIFKPAIVWASLLAFILSINGVYLPIEWQNCFTVLGSATGGLALFASGIILFQRRPKFSTPVWINTAIKNIILPSVIFRVMLLFNTNPHITNMALVSLSIPTAAIATIFASQYKIAEQEMASTLFLSTFTSVFTLAGLIVIRHI
ncbi:permease [Agrilactobacillus composti DSM 18527 = JCM 14202]|uniref:Permease n=1 Tax=Agrilactobacillus composti DSM 18527 = JCM 14202 TaxID=1423734 RepID=A0A0R1XWN6_9LACO|nr:AEC family transporter [Agrilactobacillus composti]KRM34647.1 permease [Agrilactobacillus composti DSM 18527 = JCM 14202]